MRRRTTRALGVTSAVVAALALAACSSAPSGAAGGNTSGRTAGPSLPASDAGVGILGHSGRYLTDAAGQVVILHGLDMVAKRPPYTPASAGFGSVAAAALAANGLDVVRLGVIYAAVEPRPGVIDEHYVGEVAATVATLARRGVYSLLDFHQDQLAGSFGGEGFPAWSVETDGLPVRRIPFPLGYTDSPALDRAFDNFWGDRPGPGAGRVGLQARYVEALVAVARRFAGDPWVLGYDLFNEPWPANATTTELAEFYRRAIAGIRTADPRHLIFYEPFVLFDFGQPTQLPRLGDPELAMSFHDYCLGTTGTACSRSEDTVVANALAHSRATGVALMLTEFGSTDDLADLTHVVRLADQHDLSWAEWAYCGCGDPTGSVPTSIEALVYDPARPATGANVDVAKLDVLAEPYPRLVSGTPLSYSYERSRRRFELSYSTTGVAGRRFPPGACTLVVVPPVQYPDGYEARVTGGRVRSVAGSGWLEIASASAARTVTVVVTPGKNGLTRAPGRPPPAC